jgi:hypothetical protein
MPSSGTKQEAVWLRKIENNQAHFKLRRNFEEKITIDDEGNETKTWEYEEVDVVIPNRSNVVEWVKGNFDVVWYSNPFEMAKKLLEQ